MPKRASTANTSDSPPSKRAKSGFSSATNSLKKSQNKQPVSPATQVDSDGYSYWELSSGGTRRATVSEFKGKWMVNIREYYNKEGELKPGSKGIALPVDQYSALLEVLPQIEEALKERGETVPRPSYHGAATAVESAAAEENEQEEENDDHEDEAEEDNVQEETKPVKSPKSLEPKRPVTKEAKKNYEATDDEEDGEPVSGNGASKLAKFKYG